MELASCVIARHRRHVTRITARMSMSRLLLSPLVPWQWGKWFARDDVVMGGLSSSRARVTPSGELVFEGVVRTENNGGFAQVRTELDFLRSVDNTVLQGGTRLTAQVRGDGKRYKLVATRVNDAHGVYFSHDFATIRGEVGTVTVPLREMTPTWRGQNITGRVPQLQQGQEVQSLGFMVTAAGGQAGEFQLEVLSIAIGTDAS